QLIPQRTPGDSGCDQEFIVNTDGTGLHRISSGKGRTTCGYFFDHDRRIFYASTEHASPACPPRPDYSQGYVSALYDYDIFVAPGIRRRRAIRRTIRRCWPRISCGRPAWTFG